MHLVDATMFYATEGGGVSTYLTAKANWLAQHSQIRHTIVAPVHSGADSNCSVIGVPSRTIPFTTTRNFRMLRSTAGAAESLVLSRPDLIEVGDPYQFAWAALKAKQTCNVPVVGYYHSDLAGLTKRRFGNTAHWIAEKYIKELYGRFDLVLAPSKAIARRLQALGIEQVVHQPLGVDTGLYSPARRDPHLREKLGLAPQTRLLVYAGRFTPEKNLPLLIEAVQRLGDGYHLLLIGGGDDIPLVSCCTHLPFQHDPATLAGVVASCDMLVHCGDKETFGLVILEAMACGLPVIGMAAGGVAELVDDQTGMLVKPGDSCSLVSAIDTLYKRDLAQIGANARRKAVSRYDWSLIVPQIILRYAGLFTSHRRAEFESRFQYAIE